MFKEFKSYLVGELLSKSYFVFILEVSLNGLENVIGLGICFVICSWFYSLVMPSLTFLDCIMVGNFLLFIFISLCSSWLNCLLLSMFMIPSRFCCTNLFWWFWASTLSSKMWLESLEHLDEVGAALTNFGVRYYSLWSTETDFCGIWSKLSSCDFRCKS